MRHSLKAIMSAPSPVGNGWHLEDGDLAVTWMTRNPAPDSVLQDSLAQIYADAKIVKIFPRK